MDLKLIRKEEGILEFEMIGEDHTFLGILREALNNQDEVVFAAYRSPHPILSNPIFHLKTSEASSIEAVENAGKYIIDLCNDFEKLVEKQFD